MSRGIVSGGDSEASNKCTDEPLAATEGIEERLGDPGEPPRPLGCERALTDPELSTSPDGTGGDLIARRARARARRGQYRSRTPPTLASNLATGWRFAIAKCVPNAVSRRAQQTQGGASGLKERAK